MKYSNLVKFAMLVLSAMSLTAYADEAFVSEPIAEKTPAPQSYICHYEVRGSQKGPRKFAMKTLRKKATFADLGSVSVFDKVYLNLTGSCNGGFDCTLDARMDGLVYEINGGLFGYRQKNLMSAGTDSGTVEGAGTLELVLSSGAIVDISCQFE